MSAYRTKKGRDEYCFDKNASNKIHYEHENFRLYLKLDFMSITCLRSMRHFCRFCYLFIFLIYSAVTDIPFGLDIGLDGVVPLLHSDLD